MKSSAVGHDPGGPDLTWSEADVCQFVLHVVGADVEQVQVRLQYVQLTPLPTQTLDLLSR